jgi:hypothetical protein
VILRLTAASLFGESDWKSFTPLLDCFLMAFAASLVARLPIICLNPFILLQ